MVTGYQRQHRKAISYVASEGGDPQTTDQYTRLVSHICNRGAIHEQFSKACELSAVAGLCLLQPYLDYSSSDPAQGELKVKIWEYNSFMVDSFAREPDFSDAQFIYCQEYVSRQEAKSRFGDRASNIPAMQGSSASLGSFYFLPETRSMAFNN